MAGRALTPAGVILKWILIPIACIACGFYLIGAKIGRILPGFGAKPIEVTPVADADSAASMSPSAQRAQHFAAPEVTVASHRKPTHHRTRSRSATSEATNAPQTTGGYEDRKNPDARGPANSATYR